MPELRAIGNDIHAFGVDDIPGRARDDICTCGADDILAALGRVKMQSWLDFAGRQA